MKSIWKTNPQDTWPRWDDCRQAGCDRIYFPMLKEVFKDGQVAGFETNTRERNLTHRTLVGTQHFLYGQYRDPHWPYVENPDHAKGAITEADDLVNVVSEDLAAVRGTLAVCPYMLDIEYPYRDPVWLLRVFKSIRGLFPRGPLSWTMEPMQGGWIGSDSPAARKLVKFINTDTNFVVVPQTFGGSMEPYALDRVRNDMISAKIRPNRIKLFYDAEKVRPAGWDGCLFHNERLKTF